MMNAGKAVGRMQLSLKKALTGVLSGLILATVLFMYLYMTNSSLLWHLPILSKSMLEPAFFYHFNVVDLNSPRGIAIDSLDNVYIADNLNNVVRVFSKFGKPVGAFGSEELVAPYDLEPYNGLLYVTDHVAGKVLSYTYDGTFKAAVLERGQDGLGLFAPTAITIDPANGHLYVTDVAEHRIVVSNREGEILFTFGGPGEAIGSLSYPGGIALDKHKNIYVADSNNGRIQVFSPDGSKVLYVIHGNHDGTFSLPASIAVDKFGFLWVVDTFTHTVSVFNQKNLMVSFGGLGVDEGELYFPYGIELDRSGNIYITERALNRVSVFGGPAVANGRSRR